MFMPPQGQPQDMNQMMSMMQQMMGMSFQPNSHAAQGDGKTDQAAPTNLEAQLQMMRYTCMMQQ
jgi:hypothetical protein